MKQKGFAPIIFLLAIVGVGILGGVYFFKFRNNSNNSQPSLSNPSSYPTSEKPVQNSPTTQAKLQTKTNPYLGIPCVSNPNPKFTHDFTEVDKILKVTPNSMIASKLQDRVFLWIDESKTNKVPIYAPVDSDLFNGVYKISQTIETIDYDLHFQVSCEVWFFINHVSDPVDKLKKFFPKTPADNTTSENYTKFSPPLHFNAGELIGYTTGTAQAHNFDFAVFDLNHTNTLIGGGGSNDARFKNFICPFDVLPENLKSEYYKKLDPSLIPESNCK